MHHRQSFTNYDSFYLSPDLFTENHLSLVNQERKTLPFHNFTHNPLFDKEQLEQLPDHKWMKDMEFTLVTQEEFPDLVEDFLPHFLKTLVSLPNPEELKLPSDSNKLIYGLDLETDGLNKEMRFIGGAPRIRNRIIGICLGSSSSKGYYIPVLHNEKDGVKNYPYSIAMKFLTLLQSDDLVAVYHNCVFDREVLEQNKVTLNDTFFDTQYLLQNMGYKEKYMTVALKLMSAKILKRKMLEIKELSGEKKFVPFVYYPAKTVSVYGCSDAVNTYALLLHVKESELNPYKVNPFAMTVDDKSADITRWMLRLGMPLDYPHLYHSVRTCLRRKRICEYLYKKNVTDDPERPITSPEKVGIFLGTMLKDAFYEYATKKKPDMPEDSMFEAFKVRMKEHFYMEVKKKKLKSGTVKVTYGSGADVLASYLKIREKQKTLPWIPDSIIVPLETAAKLLDVYRSVCHDLGVFSAMYRHAYVDDLNIHRCAIGLKFNGTVTNRYSNDGAKGSSDRYLAERLKTKTKVEYKVGEGTAGFNLQGVSSVPLFRSKALKVTKAPQEFLDAKKRMDNQIELDLIKLMEQI